MINWVRWQYERLKRMIFWGWHLKDSVDFDAYSVYHMLHLKFDRIYKEMLESSHLMWNDDENTPLMRRLREARELARRLDEDNYQIMGLKDAEARYGELQRSFSRYKDTDLWQYHIEFPYKNEEAQKYWKIRNKHYHNVEKTHKERFFYLLNRYMDHWWD